MRRPSLGARFTLSIGLVILAASALVFAGVYRLQEEQALAQLDTQAKALLSQMVVLRQWVADYGGVWTTQAGDYWWTERAGYYQKTPAMVTKELSSRSDALGYYRFHITSLKLKNPENAPNDFEREALHGFEVNPVPVGDVEPVGNARMYRYMIPLRTSAACLQCHGEQGYQVGDVRGGLSVLVPMAAMEETLAQNRLALALAAGALVAIVMAILYLLIARLIVRPIHQLRVVTVAVGQGNYDVSCAIRTGDELQVLGEAVNQMVHGLKRSHAELHQKIERRNRELASFSNITLMTSQSAALDDVLRGALDETVAVMHVDGGAIHLWDDDRSALTLAATNGLPSKMARLWERHTPVAELAEQPRLIADVPTDSRAVDRVLQENGYRALASIPLKSKNRVLGVMHLLARAARQFTDEDSALLACIGNQIGMAVENTRYTERVEQMAIIEERSRLAREIHDSLAQALGYLNLKTEMLEGTIARGELDGAAREIADVRRVVRDACYDVRESIDGLRTRLSDGAGLFPATAAYLHEFGQRSGLLTEYSVADGEVRLPPVVETEVLRIIQEALANVRKHAQASRVRVAIETVEGASRIVVADDGRGFDLNALDQAQHFGLRIMRERAESLGGTFHVESAPARGTIVTVQVPVTHAKGAQE
jgi:two-component system nitrate/nitrite sensor histidine kinase NarX